MYVPEVRFS